MSGISISGIWVGEFAYPDGLGPKTPFTAQIEDSNGTLRGFILEPNLIGSLSEELGATIQGLRQDSVVDFVKTYDGASDAAHSVDYVGRLSDDGTTISGVWSFEAFDGTFAMQRQRGAAILEAVETGAEVGL
jgi:hypothetical protein